MHVPYSMSDEPDLGDEFSGGNSAARDATRWDGNGFGDVDCRRTVPAPMYTFANEQELVQSDVFQKHLTMALAHKDRQIDELRKEILSS